MGNSKLGLRRYRIRSAPGPDGGTASGPSHALLLLVRHGRYHPRLRAAGAVYGPQLVDGAAREAA